MLEPIESEDDTVEVQVENNEDTGGVSDEHSTDVADTGGVPEPVPSVDTESDTGEPVEIEDDSEQVDVEIEIEDDQEQTEDESDSGTATKAGAGIAGILFVLWIIVGVDTENESSDDLGLL